MNGFNPVEWPALELAVCGDCGQWMVPRADRAAQRCYGCGCPQLIDADDLEEAITSAVFEHLRRRLTRLSFGSRRIRAVWHHSDAVTRQAMIRTELVAVTVSHGDGRVRLACQWNTEQPGSRPDGRAGRA
jgi:hypothetical protein